MITDLKTETINPRAFYMNAVSGCVGLGAGWLQDFAEADEEMQEASWDLYEVVYDEQKEEWVEV